MNKNIIFVFLAIITFSVNLSRVDAVYGCTSGSGEPNEEVRESIFTYYGSDSGVFKRYKTDPLYHSVYGTLDVAPNWREIYGVSPLPSFPAYDASNPSQIDETDIDLFTTGSVHSSYAYFEKLRNNLQGKYIIDEENKTVKFINVYRLVLWANSGGVWQSASVIDPNTRDRDILAHDLPERLVPFYYVSPFETKLFSIDEMYKDLELKLGGNVSKITFDSSSIKPLDRDQINSFSVDYNVNSSSDKIDLALARLVAIYSIKENRFNITAPDISISNLEQRNMLFEIYISKLESNYQNLSNDPTKPATGMGMNIKRVPQLCRVIGTQYFITFSGEFTYELEDDECNPDIAQDPNAEGFELYWTNIGTISRPKYLPTEYAMTCNCAENDDGTFKYPEFHNQVNGANTSGYYNSDTDYRTEDSLPLNLTCEYSDSNDNACSLADIGSYTEEKIQECCDINAPGFDEDVCPLPENIFNLKCDSPLTDTKTYISTEEEISGNDVCHIKQCSEEGRVRFDDSPYTVAGQGFTYDAYLNSKLSCEIEYDYGLTTSPTFASKYNDYVDTRIDKYNTYLDKKADYEAYNKLCPTTYKKCYSDSCCTGRPAYTKTRCFSFIGCFTYTVPSTCEYDRCCTTKTWCYDPDIRKSTYDSNLRAKKSAMDSAYSAYLSAYRRETNFLDDKTECDDYFLRYNTTGDFDLRIEENGISTYNMRESKRTLSSPRIISSTKGTQSILSCSRTATSCSSYRSETVYDDWIKQAEYRFTFTYPDEIFIDRSTGIASTSKTDYYYSAGYRYFTDLGTLTGRYNLETLEVSDGFGYWGQWDLYNKKVPCWYDISNNLGPSEIDSNYPVYGNIGIEFRVVNLDDLFPGRNPGTNWESEPILIGEIEEKGDSVYQKEPVYTITLTPDSMNKVRDYVDNHNYSDWYNFEFEDYQAGTSGFLDELTKYDVDMKINKDN